MPPISRVIAFVVLLVFIVTLVRLDAGTWISLLIACVACVGLRAPRPALPES